MNSRCSGKLNPQNSRVFSAEFDIIHIASTDNNKKDLFKQSGIILFTQDPTKGE